MKKILTLGIANEPSRILLALKKKGFGKDRWNGFGGKLEPGETIEQGMIREIKEESSIFANKIEKRGIIDFEFKGNPEILEVHIFKILDFKGTPTETSEMKPQWFPIDKIPFRQMWPDDPHWLPLFLKDKKFKGKFLFGENDTILNFSLNEVGEI